MSRPIILFYLFVANNLLVSGQAIFPPVEWQTTLHDLGTFSSPRMVDLNNDGTLDVVMGAGREEFHHCDTAVFALDGKTGSLLWTVSARDQIFGSAALMDITDDGIPDVFIGGRSAELIAIDGASGQVIWRFLPDDDVSSVRDKGWYNFYNPQFVPDQNGDGVRDMLISNGGDVLAEAYDTNRVVGHLLLINPLDGSILYKARMPDGYEIYMSTVCSDLNHDGEIDVLFGTGGETTPGYFYRTSLKALSVGDISQAVVLADGRQKGFIAPPVIVEITGDSVLDFVTNSVDGRMLAFDGKTNQPIWAGRIPNTEVYSSLAVADLNADDVPDFFGNFAHGVWPDLEATRPLLVDGKEGQLLFIDSIGFYQMSSAVIADFNADGFNDGLISTNFFKADENGRKTIHNSLLVYDFMNQAKFAISSPMVGSNVSSTPWVGDVDQDGLLDIIYCLMITPDKVYTYDGFKIIRLKTDIPINRSVSWGAYMGSAYDGIFR